MPTSNSSTYFGHDAIIQNLFTFKQRAAMDSEKFIY